MERRCAEEEKRQDLSHLDPALSITEQLAASSFTEHLGLSSFIEELSSPPFVSSRCPRCPKNSLLTTAPPSHILFTCYPLLPPPLSEKARGPALCPPQSSHRLTFPTFSPRHDITGPVPFWSSSLLHPPSMPPPGFKDPYCLQITIKLNYLKICWLYDQTYMMIAWRSICFC